MAFDTDGARKAGYSDAEIADHLAQVAKFDAGQARKAGYADADIIKHLTVPAESSTTANLAAGALRGAGSIGATLLTPVDWLAKRTGAGGAINKATGLTLFPDDRRAAMDQGLQEWMGADPASLAFKAGKIGMEVAGTLGVGPAIAAPLAGVKALAPVAEAVASGGFKAAGMTGAKGLAARSVGGAITGGASTALVGPEDAGTGAAIGAGLPVLLNIAGRAGRGVASVAGMFTDSGAQRIATRALQAAGVTPQSLDAAAASSAAKPSAQLTMAERLAKQGDIAGAAKAASLMDNLRAVNPDVAAELTAREISDNARRVGTLRDLAGEGGEREFSAAARDTAAKELYQKAFAAKMDLGGMSAAERGEVTKLFNTPAVREATMTARMIAANSGKDIKKPEGSVEGLHLTKLALDDAIESASKGGSAAAANKAASLRTARDRLTTFIERVSPAYGEARATYAAMSQPLNQMDTAAELLRKGTAATSNLDGELRMMPSSLLRTARDEAHLIKSATGRNAASTLDDLFSNEPEKLAKLRSVLGDADLAAALARAANGPGAASAKRLLGSSKEGALVAGDVLRELGLPPTGALESLSQLTVGKLARWTGREERVQRTLGELLQNPASAGQQGGSKLRELLRAPAATASQQLMYRGLPVGVAGVAGQ